MERLLVVPAGYYQLPAIARLVREGFWVVAADGNPAAKALSIAHKAVVVDIKDAEALTASAKAHKVGGILTLNDWALEAATIAAQELGFNGVNPEVVVKVRNKASLRETWEAHGLAQPRFRVVESAEEAVRAGHDVGWPCIIKPDWSGGGSRGVMVVAHEKLMPKAYSYTRSFALEGKVVVEEWMRGVESSVEGIIIDNEPQILAISSKSHIPSAARMDKYLTYPGMLPRSTMGAISQLVIRALRAAGVDNCPFHVEVITDSQGPRLVEMAPRPGGGHVFSHMVELASGVCFPRVAAELALGGRPRPSTTEAGGGCYWFFYPPAGRLKEVQGVERARTMEGVVELGITASAGQNLGMAPGSLGRGGFVVTRGRGPEEALERARAGEEAIEFVVEQDNNQGSQSLIEELTTALGPWLELA